MDTEGLYRKEALEALRAPSHSATLLAQPISFRIFVGVSFCIATMMILYFIFGTYTQRETVNGYVTPASGMFRIYVPQPGIVLSRFVQLGERVHKGDRLLLISADLSVSSLGRTQAGVIDQVQHRKVLLGAEQQRTHQMQLAQKEALELSIQGIKQQASDLDQVIEDDRQRLDTSELLYNRYAEVRNKNYMSEEEFLRKKEELLQQREQFARLKMNRADLDRQLHAQQLKLRDWPLEDQAALSEIDRQISELDQQLQEDEGKRTLTISAPEDGVVAVLGGEVGQLVQPTRPVAIAGALRAMPCREARCVQLQEARLLPLLRRPTHGRDRGAFGR